MTRPLGKYAAQEVAIPSLSDNCDIFDAANDSEPWSSTQDSASSHNIATVPKMRPRTR